MGKVKRRVNRSEDALDLMDKRFGVGPQSDALHEQFTEQAEVAEMLFAARNAAGVTQKELANLAGTTQQVISQLENADYEGHTTSLLRRIAKALNSRLEIRLVPKGARAQRG
jgi:DNA-binding XRE family transcriptional regulator